MFTDEQLHHPILTHDQEIALGQRIQAGDCDALDELVCHNLRLVYKVARRASTDDPATDFDDLVQEGMLGLLIAAQKYDPSRANRFSTYAHWWIEQKISRAILTAGPIPRSANPEYPRKTRAAIRNHALRQAPVARLDAPLRDRRGDDSENTLADILADMSPSVEDTALANIEVKRILSILRLDPRGQAIVHDWLAGIPRGIAQAAHGVSSSWLYSIVEKKLRDRKDMFMPREKSSTICIEPGCDQPRYVNAKGTTLTRCHEHQKAFWREAQKARAAAEHHPEAARSNSHDIDRTFHDLERAGNSAIRPFPPRSTPSLAEIEQSAVGTRHTLSDPVDPPPAAPPIHRADEDYGCTCPDCIYREVVALLAARNPRIAELVDVLQAARRLRDDLGI